MKQLYKCNKCGESSYAEEWNECTMEDADDCITRIEEIDIGNENYCYYFICPNCGETCYNEDGHISLDN